MVNNGDGSSFHPNNTGLQIRGRTAYCNPPPPPIPERGEDLRRNMGIAGAGGGALVSGTKAQQM